MNEAKYKGWMSSSNDLRSSFGLESVRSLWNAS